MNYLTEMRTPADASVSVLVKAQKVRVNIISATHVTLNESDASESIT